VILLFGVVGQGGVLGGLFLCSLLVFFLEVVEAVVSGVVLGGERGCFFVG